jgi:YHS domain-containing protein
LANEAVKHTLIKMNFLARIVRFLFWLLVLSWGLRLLRRIVGGMLRNNQAPAPQTADPAEGIPVPSAARRLVRDPVCGLHVDETLSIPLRDGGELLHFCSPACRDAYAVNVRKLAANG